MSAIRSSELPGLSERERYLIRHALGFGVVNRARVSYRNYYNSPDHGPDFDVWTGLVNRGLAVSWKTELKTESIPGVLFAATEKAARAAKKRHEGFDDEILAHFKRIELKLQKAAA